MSVGVKVEWIEEEGAAEITLQVNGVRGGGLIPWKDNASGAHAGFTAVRATPDGDVAVAGLNFWCSQAEAARGLLASVGFDNDQLPEVLGDMSGAAGFVNASCQGELCTMCGAPAVAKVGEEIAHDDPMPHRHNLTAYVCEQHFNQIMRRGSAGTAAVLDPCLEKREPGEPMFVLLARDAAAPVTLEHWASVRQNWISYGVWPDTAEEREHIAEVLRKADTFRAWRREHRPSASTSEKGYSRGQTS